MSQQASRPHGDDRSVVRVVLAAGGTAGHVEPAINLAEALADLAPVEVSVLGGTRGLETTLVPARGLPLLTVPAVPMPRRPTMDLVRLPGRMRAAVAAAEDHLRTSGAQVVVGFGGYAAVPGYLAARRLGLPIVVHEANARAGLANRMAARFTPHVFTAVPDTIRGATVIGLPLRRTIARLDRNGQQLSAREALGLRPDQPVLLVFGGSQGATSLNATVAGALDAVLDSGAQVLHAVGPRNDLPPARPGYHPVKYLDRMDLAYAAADLAVTRAGAMTCAECAAVGLPAVYVPLPIGNGEQRLNAVPVVQAGGGVLVEDARFTPEWLSEVVVPLLHDDSRLAAMGEAAGRHGVRDADVVLAKVVLRLVQEAGRDDT